MDIFRGHNLKKQIGKTKTNVTLFESHWSVISSLIEARASAAPIIDLISFKGIIDLQVIIKLNLYV